MKHFPANLKLVAKSNLLTIGFLLVFLAKLTIFNYLNNLWPALDGLPSFFAYTFITAAILTVPALYINKHKLKYLVLVDTFLSVVLLVDGFYIRFFDTLPVVSLLGATSVVPEIAHQLGSLFSWKDLATVIDFPFILYLVTTKRGRGWLRRIPAINEWKTATFLTVVLLMVTTAQLVYDSHEKLPYLYNQISENKVVAKNIGIFGAHIMDISRNFAEAFDTVTVADKANAFAVIKANTTKLTTNQMTGVAAGKRVIMIQVESLNNFVINEKVNGQEVTPNLNKLAASSHYFADDYFTLGAGGTSDADFTTNTSMYPLVDASAFVKYGKDNFTSLEKELKAVGYTTNAYHANSRGYWNRNTVFKSLGFDNFFAEDNYQKGEIVNMGLNDKDFLKQSFTMIQAQPDQSFNYLITLSSHFSFDIPAWEKGLDLPNGKYPAITTNYLEAIHYTDNAIGDFLGQLKDNGMYDDSLIVVYGDHTAKYDAFTDDSGNRVDLNTTAGKRIPLFIKLPGQVAGTKVTTPTSHLDIMPTILNLVGAKPTSPMFGRDLFGKAPTFFFTAAFENDFEQIISGSLKYLNNNTSLTCYKYVKKQATTVDLATCNPLLDKRNQIQDAVDILIKHNLFSEYLK